MPSSNDAYQRNQAALAICKRKYPHAFLRNHYDKINKRFWQALHVGHAYVLLISEARHGEEIADAYEVLKMLDARIKTLLSPTTDNEEHDDIQHGDPATI